MKNLIFMMAIMALCLAYNGNAMAGDPVTIKPGPGISGGIEKNLPPTQPTCPPGFTSFTSSNIDFGCARSRPSAPCPQGYHVMWGSCTPPAIPSTFSPGTPPVPTPPCSFTCIPDSPPNLQFYCPPSSHLESNACSIGCRPGKTNIPR